MYSVDALEALAEQQMKSGAPATMRQLKAAGQLDQTLRSRAELAASIHDQCKKANYPPGGASELAWEVLAPPPSEEDVRESEGLDPLPEMQDSTE